MNLESWGHTVTVAQDGRVPHAVLLRAQLRQGVAGQQTAIAGMHAHHAVLDRVEHLQRVLAGQNGIGGVVIDAEPWRVDGLDDAAEDTQVLRELGVRPVVVLVVVLQRQDHAALGGVGQQLRDALHDHGHALVLGNLRGNRGLPDGCNRHHACVAAPSAQARRLCHMATC